MEIKKLFVSFLSLLMGISALAQVPQAFNYQGSARNASGIPISNSGIAIRASIIDGSVSGNVVYSERNVTTTSGSGLFSIAIGNGSPLSGSFNSINWAQGNKFLKIELDGTGGFNYITMGITQLLSVPYAQYAATSGQSLPSVMTVSGSLSFVTDEFGQILNDKSGIEVDLVGSSPLISSITDAKGAFTLPNLPTGTYNITLNKSGFYGGTTFGVSFVSGGLKSISFTPTTNIVQISTTLPQNLSASTGPSFLQPGYNAITVSGIITPPGTPSSQRYVSFFYSTTPGINGVSVGTPLSFDAAVGSVFGAGGSSAVISAPSFNLESVISNNSQIVPTGQPIYIKAFGANFNGFINYANASNEISLVLPPPFINYTFSNFSVSTTVGNSNNGIHVGYNGVSIAFTLNPLPFYPVTVDLYISTQPIPSDFTALNTSNILQTLEVSTPANSDSYSSGTMAANFIQSGYTVGTKYYVRAFSKYPDGSVNNTSPSALGSFILPPSTSVGGPGTPCLVGTDCLSGTCSTGFCK